MSQTQSKLERRARALLRAYPAEYRHGRAEEMIGTLLEAAPPGRSFPTAREAWSLLAGGRCARAARNRRPGVKVNLRLALVLALSTYLSFTSTAGWYLGRDLPWTAIATLVLSLAVAAAPWLESRVVTAALAVPAGALVVYSNLRQSHDFGVTAWAAEFLLVLAALAALSGGPVRLPRSWLLLPGVFPLAMVLGSLLLPRHVANGAAALGALLLLLAAVLCWLVTDARPALALALAVLLDAVINIASTIVFGPSQIRIPELKLFMVEVAVIFSVLLPAAWLLLHRRPSPGTRPFAKP